MKATSKRSQTANADQSLKNYFQNLLKETNQNPFLMLRSEKGKKCCRVEFVQQKQ